MKVKKKAKKVLSVRTNTPVQEMDNIHEAIDTACRLNKPILGPCDLKETKDSKGRMGITFFFPIEEDDPERPDYAFLVIFEEELQGFLDYAREKKVEVVPVPWAITLDSLSNKG